ncbi:MAG TPA: ComF family protein [Ferruginibacter sp.]|nr:ComF family protein [Ferruginibacter sp.]
MHPVLEHIISSTLHVFYPHVCTGCGSDLLGDDNRLCLHCQHDLPHTGFAVIPDNPIEKQFWGRIPIEAGHSEFYFAKEFLLQHLIHQLKYKGNQDIGKYLGELTGMSLQNSNRFQTLDAIIPLPLYPEKERKRGYNQAAVIAEGISSVLNIPVINAVVIRSHATETQTRKHRTERWENVNRSFRITDPQQLAGKHVLLVDDVITTGATLEACGEVILETPSSKLSIATLAYAPK